MGSIGVEAFSTIFAVPLHCDSCVKDITNAVGQLDGIQKIDASIKDQLVFIEGSAAPSAIVAAIESTGRDAILRGSGKSNSAGVCILETHADVSNPVKGLVRMVEVGKDMTLVDLTVRGLSPGTYHATVRATGDISQGAASTGGIWEAVKALGGFSKSQPQTWPRGYFGRIEVGNDGKGNAFLDRPISIWEVIGRGMVVSHNAEGPFDRHDPETLVGVVARSAGVWENDKTVCSCSGKTVWEERKEQSSRGML